MLTRKLKNQFMAVTIQLGSAIILIECRLASAIITYAHAWKYHVSIAVLSHIQEFVHTYISIVQRHTFSSVDLANCKSISSNAMRKRYLRTVQALRRDCKQCRTDTSWQS